MIFLTHFYPSCFFSTNLNKRNIPNRFLGNIFYLRKNKQNFSQEFHLIIYLYYLSSKNITRIKKSFLY
nr:MAG TPA: hypothetical protein [Caudoviricetes sp.]